MSSSFSWSLLPFVAATCYFLLVDGLWISFFVLDTYKSILKASIGDFQLPYLPFVAAFVYLLLVGGLMIFALPHVKKSQCVVDALVYGGLYGLVVYGVYSGTNYTVIQGWNMWLLITDCLWGMFICASTLAVYVYVSSIQKGAPL